MHPFEVIMVICTTSLVLVTALLLMVRRMPSRPGIEWWLGASVTLSFSYLLAYIFHDAETTLVGEVVFYTLQLFATYGVSIGTLLFLGYQISLPTRLALFCATLGTVILLRIDDQQFLATLIFAGYHAVNMLHIASRLIVLGKERKGSKAAALMCFLTGLHWLDYPFLKDVEWFVPIGFLIAMILVVGIAIGLAALALFQFEKQTKESEQKAIYAANHDPLTGLYNRSYLDQLFAEYVSEADKAQRSFALLYLDLDGFKAVNDSYGHQAGDLLLKVIAKRMTNRLKIKGDTIRIGGDELIVLTRLRGDCQTDNVYGLARSILNTIEQPIADCDKTYHVSASIGVCCYPLHGNNLDEMTRQADRLMYAAKQAGGKRIRFADFSKKDRTGESEQPGEIVEEKVLEEEST